ncbi:hypothetical protein N0V90_003290 [Kalmusia sp. IMI 367209]|nr:hypothetical protein N0V90_003290 [Kalmusia sp. IMI 367209]
MAHVIGPSLMDIPTICFGFTLGFGTLTISKAGKQTLSVVRRKHGIWSPYLFMIWIEIIVCLAMAILSWLFVRGDIKPKCVTPFPPPQVNNRLTIDIYRLWYFFVQVTLWSIQLQLLLQIIANRISLILPNRHDGRRLKIYLFLAILAINISVYCIWIPARMAVSPTWIKLNDIWDRIEKVIYLIIDAGLNAYFLYLVKVRLVDAGLIKYKELWRFNAGIASISISMDLLIIGMMSLPNDLVYVQFHPLSYIIKLNIELCMADLISKVVRKRDRTDKPHEHDSSSNPSQGTELATRSQTYRGTTLDSKSGFKSHITSQARGGSPKRLPDKNQEGKAAGDSDGVSISSSESGINFRVPEEGIVRSVAVEITVDDVGEKDEQRSTKSTSRLRGQGDW